MGIIRMLYGNELSMSSLVISSPYTVVVRQLYKFICWIFQFIKSLDGESWLLSVSADDVIADATDTGRVGGRSGPEGRPGANLVQRQRGELHTVVHVY